MTYDKFLKLQKDLEPDDVLILVKRVKSSDSEISVIGEADDAVLAATKTIVLVGNKSPRRLYQWINAVTTISAHLRKLWATDEEQNIIQGLTIGNKEAARELVDVLVPDESKISALHRDLIGDFDISYVMGEILFKQGGEWKLDSEDMENCIHWMTEPSLKIFSDVAFKGFDYCKEMFGDKAVEFYLIERKTKCLGIPEMDYFCDVYKG